MFANSSQNLSTLCIVRICVKQERDQNQHTYVTKVDEIDRDIKIKENDSLTKIFPG
jgi:hypothetical protein